jgi:CHRD domain-containing protein
MLNLRTNVVAGLAATSLLYLASGVEADGGRSRVKARLNGYQENPSISTTGRGTFTAKIDDEAMEIHYTLTYSGIEGGTAVAAHIHVGDRHTNGGVSAFLCSGGDKPACPATEGTVTGVIDAADVVGPAVQGVEPGAFDELVRAIRAGVTYANVHSAPRWPGGEIRGQIVSAGDDDHDD